MAIGYPPIPVYPLGIDSDETLYLVYNTSETITSSNNQPLSDEIQIVPVGKNASEIWAGNGYANISGELFYYDSVGLDSHGHVNCFKRCARGIGGSSSTFNPAGTWVRGFVVAEHHNQLSTTAIAIEHFLGKICDVNLGVNTADANTISCLLAQLQNEQPCQNDSDCPLVNLTFNTTNDPTNCVGSVASYIVTVQGSYNSFLIDFGDGNSSTELQGTHTYSPNATIDPVVNVSNSNCQIVRTISTNNPISPSIPSLPVPFEINIPEFRVPTVVIPNINVPPVNLSFPPFVTPNIEIGGFSIPSIIIPTFIQFSPLTIPTFIQFSPLNIPTFIQFSPISIPTFIQFSDINLPTFIQFSNLPVFTFIQFSPINIPSEIQLNMPGNVPIPSQIQLNMPMNLPIPSLITLLLPMSQLTVITSNMTNPNAFEILTPNSNPGQFEVITPNASTPGAFQVQTTNISNPDQFTTVISNPTVTLSNPTITLAQINQQLMVNWGSPPQVSCIIVIQCPVSSGLTGMRGMGGMGGTGGLDGFFEEVPESNDISAFIPSEINVIAPKIPDVKVVHSIPTEISVKAPNIPDIKIIGPEVDLPRQIDIVDKTNLPRSIELISSSLPSKITLDASEMPRVIRLESSVAIPTYITIDGTNIPRSIQVVGIPDSIELKGHIPSEIKLVVPKDLEVPLVFKGEPIPVKLDLKSLMSSENEELPCFSIVPCKK